MESNEFDSLESFSAARNPTNDHLSYPATADEHTTDETLLLQPSSERLVQSDKLYVGNLPPHVSIVDLHKAFKRFGQITDIQLPYNTGPGGKPKGYAFMMFGNREDAARAQVKMDGAILSKRIIKVDFAHQEKSNPILKNRKSAKDASQVTTLSMLKGSQHTRSTREQIALAEAKLRELGRADHRQEGSSMSSSSSSLHPSLPSKPPVGLAQLGSSRSSVTPKPKSTLPSLPLPTPAKHPVASHSSIQKTSPTPLPSASVPSGSLSTSTKKTSRLTGIKIIKKIKDSNLQES